ncbi:cobalamin biosynthesis protein [Nocardia veterana]|uniref:Cobalamin biosynthesis protein n=1 Tax=Nocardia veterana TaxID=132249 RepID=A0A7X6LUI4_9NOCA|nr:cobalamin biosynthesis protein [Nocardia veterana]NKY84866.1 cobalamin biosynthesis protein [Nocardia veterana]
MTGAVVVGIGARPEPEAAAIVSAVRKVVGDRSIRCLATVDRRAHEPGLVAAAAKLGVPVVVFTASELAQVDVPGPAHRTALAVGTPSVAEAAALLACRRGGGSGRLIVPKTAFATITVAVAEPDSTRPGISG